MFRSEIDKLFTEEVTNYIAKGYTIHTNTMSGTQGEIAKVDLTNGDEVIRILLTTKYDWEEGDQLIITVGRNTDRLTGHRHDTIWDQNLEVIKQYKFVELKQDEYYVAPEGYPEIKEKRHERWANKNRNEHQVVEMSEAAKKAVLPWVKRQPKCKTVKLDEIESVTKHINKSRFNGKVTVGYRVKVRGNELHIKVSK